MILSRQYPVRADELDNFGVLTPEALVAYMQDSAAHHARELGCGIEKLSREGKGWALSQLRLKVSRMPEWGEPVTVETWPSGIDRLFAFRDYRFLSDDMEFGSAESSWVIFDLDNRRPCRLPAEFKEVTLKRGVESRLDKLEFQLTEDASESARFSVRKDDTDFNGHVNHVRIAHWLLSHGGQEGRLSSLQIDFRAEAAEGDSLVLRWMKDAEGQHHTLNRSSDQKLLALAKTEASS